MPNNFNEGKKQEYIKIIRFACTGVLNTGVDYGIFTMLGLLGVNIYLSQCLSYCCGVLNSYVINRKWTFRTNQKFFSKQLLKFVLVNLALLALSLLTLYLFCTCLGYSRSLGKLISVAITMGLGFVLNRLWVF